LFTAYLDKYRSSIPTTQGNQILKLLTKKKDSGEIKTINEFKKYLKDLTNKLLKTYITPTLKIYQAIAGKDISSTVYNEMLERVEDDLETLFNEADNIDQLLVAHNNLIDNVVLNAIHFAINELDSKITLYEYLNKSKLGFDDTLFDTFREAKNNVLSRLDKSASFVYTDPIRQEIILISENCFVDILSEALLLGSSSNNYIEVNNVEWLSNEDSIRSEIPFTSLSSINNLIDGKDNTYWTNSILQSNINSNGVGCELCFSLNSTQNINYIEILPAIDSPIILKSIDYIDISNVRQSIINFDEVSVSSLIKISFPRVTTHKLILQFRQYNYKEIQFDINKQNKTINLELALSGASVDTLETNNINDELNNALSSSFILVDVLGLYNTEANMVKYYRYDIGFDNIKLGFNKFNERGIFVSNKKTVDQLSLVGLNVKEKRSYQVLDTTDITTDTFLYSTKSYTEDNKFYHNSIEYYLGIRLYTSNDFLISTDVIPILPLGATRVYHEQLYFAASSLNSVLANLCQLRFYTDANISDILVYKNGLLLTDNTDWQFISYGDSSGLTVNIPNDNKPMRLGIKIMNNDNLLDIYTASYTPKKSNTKITPSNTALLNIVDLIGDQSIKLTSDNIIYIDTTRKSYIVNKADIYLIVIMRRNSANDNYSPVLEEYMLLTGSRNINKYG